MVWHGEVEREVERPGLCCRRKGCLERRSWLWRDERGSRLQKVRVALIESSRCGLSAGGPSSNATGIGLVYSLTTLASPGLGRYSDT